MKRALNVVVWAPIPIAPGVIVVEIGWPSVNNSLALAKVLKNLSEYHQVISITHLPQIASLAEHHFSIEKLHQNDRVLSLIKKLPKSERITEIARLLSGEKITEASIKSAREMIGQKE